MQMFIASSCHRINDKAFMNTYLTFFFKMWYSDGVAKAAKIFQIVCSVNESE